MRISQKLEYACRALAQLARRHDGTTLTRLEDLAQREAVSANFLVQILNDLRRAGLVESRRGAAGGYMLARPAATITLRSIVDAVEPGILVNSTTHDGESGAGVCGAWERVGKSLQAELAEVTLSTLAAPPADPMFYI